MSYCPECGADLREGSKFCPDCGNDLNSDTTETDTSSDEDLGTADPSVDATEKSSLDTGRAIASGIMALLVGAIVAFAFSNFGGSSFWFLITFVGVGYFLYSREETGKLAFGMGMYIAALWMPLAPIIFYIPVAGGANADTAAGAGQAIGSVLGMFIYGFIGLIIGLVFAVIGYFVRKGESE
jgi:hypothetical protein